MVLWDVHDQKRLLDGHLAMPDGFVRDVAFSPDGTTLAAGYSVGGLRGGVVLWDVAGSGNSWPTVTCP